MAARRQRLLDLDRATVVPFGPLFWQYPDVRGSYYAFPRRTD